MLLLRALIKLKIILVAAILLLVSISTFAKEQDVLIRKKADFIIQVASSINYPDMDSLTTYKIGILGQNSKINSLYKEFQNSKYQLKIHEKPVEYFKFRNAKKVKPVDLIYIEGDSKIRINELNKQLSGHPYFIVTENFPFGMSMLNFAINKDDELFFEIQESIFKSKGAKIDKGLLSSTNRVDSLEDWQQKLNAAILVIKKQENAIDLQQEEIVKKTSTINSQYQTIVISIIFLLITIGLLFLLLRINSQKKKVLNVLEQKSKEIIDSIQYAKKIQTTILPSQDKFKEQFKEFFILYKPKSIVSGDFYWLVTEKEKVFFSVADCTGHGVPGAFISLLCSNALTKSVKELYISQPGKILDKTVELLEERFSNDNEIKDGMDLALCSIDFGSNKLEYAGANNPLYYIRKGKLEEIKSNRQPIGAYSERNSFTNHTLDIEKGDCIYIFSDGYVDQFGGLNNKKFKCKSFRKLLLDIHEKPMEEQKQILDDTFEEWKGQLEQVDDVCIMGLKI